jgi:prevent-host-death family protein
VVVESYNLADAKARLSELVARAEAGEEIEIKRRGEPAAKLVPVETPKKKIDMEELRRIRAMTPPEHAWKGPISYVQWLRETDQL